ncbi:MAG: response regulator transcription factor [Bacteroidales bacterium]|jgi:DNA-binding LytR/AlgR family response regulator|nr:response regulator transcription factor [Bacteroidales bacterium]
MNKKSAFTCIVIDDEPIAIKVIREHLEKLNQIECIGGYTKPLEAIDTLNEQKVDLLFLDINMPGISGIEFLKSLAHPPKVIFTTAYRNFAADAFDLDVLDYLLKPISFERFLKSINKFLSAKQLPEQEIKETGHKDYIIFKADKKNYKIQFSAILFIESLDNYIKIHTTDRSIVCYESLTKVEEQLPAKDFIRVHRSYIINLTKVDVFTSAYVEINNQRFTIGRNYREKVAKRLA